MRYPTCLLVTGMVLALGGSVTAQEPARTTNLGGGCGASSLALPFPLALGQSVSLNLQSPHPNAPAILGLSGPTSAVQALGPGCNLGLDLASLITVPFFTSATGGASFPVAIPSNPALIGTEFQAQAVVVSGTGPLAGSDLTNALRAEVGNPIFVLVASDRVINQSISSIDAAAALLGINPSVLINDNNPVTQGNPWLPWSTAGAGTTVRLPTGEVSSPGFAALTGALPFTLTSFVQGLVPQSQLDQIPGVMPLSNLELVNLIGKTCLVVVYDGSLSINYQPLQGNLQGARNGIFAFTVLAVEPPSLPESQSSNSTMDIVVRIEAPLDFSLAASIPARSNPSDSVQVQAAEWQNGLLTVVANSSEAPVAQMFITIEGFNYQVLMTFDAMNNQYTFTASSAISLVGRRVVVSSTLGGSSNFEVQ